ncbi:transcriptional regulator [Labrys miyagiensis]|uniref:Transcriptional regulator n=1 Tax=Labrys miyagiensis TaxID=346912 RepID=A0ABQ6CDB7_9HYPH|nr:dimethylsulfonioproprionate lyase family protein [Labrys miyagiensis]GLS17925.1 transcriptional regulator [Labrys miyagiensis]
MSERDPDLQRFVTALRTALRYAEKSAQADAMQAKVFAALEEAGPKGTSTPARLPVCDQLEPALDELKGSAAVLETVGQALATLAPSLHWIQRGGERPNANERFADGHANATIIGRGGLEEREDLRIGVSLLAPGVRYPDHDHPPEEVYLVLSPGRFSHGGEPWQEPGIGGTFHNPPGILHAMASDERPLFAIWCLWSGNG